MQVASFVEMEGSVSPPGKEVKDRGGVRIQDNMSNRCDFTRRSGGSQSPCDINTGILDSLELMVKI